MSHSKVVLVHHCNSLQNCFWALLTSFEGAFPSVGPSVHPSNHPSFISTPTKMLCSYYDSSDGRAGAFYNFFKQSWVQFPVRESFSSIEQNNSVQWIPDRFELPCWNMFIKYTLILMDSMIHTFGDFQRFIQTPIKHSVLFLLLVILLNQTTFTDYLLRGHHRACLNSVVFFFFFFFFL